MKKTTVYLPEELKSSLERLAGNEGRSEADLIREAICDKVEAQRRPKPILPLATSLGDPTYSERVDELLEGFGED